METAGLDSPWSDSDNRPQDHLGSDLTRTKIRALFDGRVLVKRAKAGEAVQPGKDLARNLEPAWSLGDRDMAMIGDAWDVRDRATGDRRAAQV